MSMKGSDIYSEGRIIELRFFFQYRMAPELLMVSDRPKVNIKVTSGYSEQFAKTNYPFNVYSAYHNAKFDVLLRSLMNDVEFICRTLIPGYKIYLHFPFDSLRATDVSFRVPFSEEVSIAIIPKLIFTAAALLDNDPIERQCFFNHERQLRFFRYYSSKNCDIECLANYTLESCGCVKFSSPSNC